MPTNSYLNSVVISSAEIEVCIAVREGGRVASLRSRESGVEFLTQAREGRADVVPGMAAKFQDGAAAGIEECMPTVGACGDAPDHGDFWQVAWDVLSATDASVTVEARGFSRPLVFRKELRVEGRRLGVGYSVRNVGEAEVDVLYACHPLFAVDAGDRVCLPAEVREVRVDYSRGGRVGGRVAWPGEMDVALGADAGVAEMIYTDELLRGACGVYRAGARQGLAVRFDARVLPYLGVWLCYGGWPDDAGYAKQYAVALEPTTANVNTLVAARDAGLAKMIEVGETLRWEICFEVSEPGVSLEEFRCGL